MTFLMDAPNGKVMQGRGSEGSVHGFPKAQLILLGEGKMNKADDCRDMRGID